MTKPEPWYATPGIRLHIDRDAGLPAGGVRFAVHRGQTAASRIFRRTHAGHAGPAHRETDAVSDRDDRVEFNRGQYVAPGRLVAPRFLRHRLYADRQGAV